MTNRKYTKEQQDYIDEIRHGFTEKIFKKFAGYKNIKQYSHYFGSDKVEGIDYIECPFTGHRAGSITKRHLKVIPNIDIEKAYKLFPELAKPSEAKSKHFNEASAKLYKDEAGNHVLNEDGKPMTNAQYSSMKSIQTLKEVDENGISGYDRLGAKTRATHLSNVDDYGMNGYQQQKLIQFENGNGIKSVGEMGRYDNYKELVSYITYKSELNYQIQGYHIIKAMKDSDDFDNDYQIDHRYSRSNGFNDNVSPFLIGHPKNTQIMSISDNMKKSANNSITIEQLYNFTGYTKERSVYEYKLYFEAVTQSYKVGDGYFNLFIMKYMVDNYALTQYRDDFIEYVKEVITSDGGRYKTNL